MLQLQPLIAVSTVELSIRMLVALVLILGMLAGINKVMGSRFGGQRGPRLPVSVRYQQRLDKQASVHLIEAGNRQLLVGTSGQSIVLLAEGTDLIVPKSRQLAEPASTEDGPAEHDPKADQSIDIRSSVNPIRLLQDRTLRRT